MLDNQYNTIFNKFNISDKDLALYKDIIAKATSFEEIESVINHFMANYVTPMNMNYNNLIQDTLNISLSTKLTEKELYSLNNTFVYSSTNYQQVLQNNFAIIAELTVDKNLGLIGGDEKLIKSMTDDLIAQFNLRIEGAMANTRSDVLGYVRKLQREMIIRNNMLSTMQQHGVAEGIIEQEKALFKKNMLKRYPQLKKQLEDGKILRSRTYYDKNGNARFKSYTLDDYAEMSVSETLKNADRDAVEYVAETYAEPAVEFYLRDNRHVETPNTACEYITSKTVFGKHLLATNNHAANVLGIWTIDRAKAENSLNISFHCRHSIRRLDADTLNKINKMITLYDMTDQEDDMV